MGRPVPRLADVVSARLALSRLFNVSSSSPWICFGGSYAGSLAAWTRLKVLGALRWARGGNPGGVRPRDSRPSPTTPARTREELCTACPQGRRDSAEWHQGRTRHAVPG